MSSSPRLTVHFDPRGELLEATRACEADIFGHWYGNTRAELDRELAAWSETCVFLAVTDEPGRVVAQVRLITPGPSGFKTLHDVAGAPWGLDTGRLVRALQVDLRHTWDVATMGVRPQGGRRGVAARVAMYHGLVQALLANEVQWGLAVLDQRVRSLMSWSGMDFPALPGAGPAPYLGSAASVPVGVDVPLMLERQRRTNPEAHRLITLGRGLDDVVVPDREAFRLQRADAGVPRPERRAG